MKPELEFLTKTLFDPASFWAMVAAVATIALIIVAYKQLRDLGRTSRADFLYRLKSDFFNVQARQLIFLTEHNLLKFHGVEIPYFEIVGHERPGVRERLKEMGIEGDSISTYLVDDILLGPLEDVGILEKLRLVSLEEAYEEFVTYMDICIENEAIQEYLKYSNRDPADDDVYDSMLGLYQKLKVEAPKIRAKKRRKNKD
jgi:hypothetical protein